MGVLCLVLVLSFSAVCHSSFTIILMGKKELVYLPGIFRLCLFLAVPWVGIQCVIVVFPDHTQVLFYK